MLPLSHTCPTADSCRICSSMNGHSNRRFQIGEFVSPVHIVFEPLCVHRVVLHPCSNPGSTLFRVKWSHHHATPAAQRRSKFRNHLLGDVDASAVLFDPGSRHCRFGRNLWVHHRKISGRCSMVRIVPPRVHPANYKDFRVFPTAARGSSVLLCFVSECCGMSLLLHCCSRCVLPVWY